MRLRVRFTKQGKVRWTSARDVARMWERAFRRVELPLAYTGGFSPRPKVSFALALPTGHESLAEYLDVELAPGASVEIATLPARLSPALPAGMHVPVVAAVDERAGSLQHEVTSCRWEVEAAGITRDELGELVERALAAESLVVTRQRKGHDVVDDIRPAIRALTLLDPHEWQLEPLEPGTAAVLACELATQPRGVRPSELLDALRPGLDEGRVLRTHQWIERDGARWEPLPVPATDAPHAEARAS